MRRCLKKKREAVLSRKTNFLHRFLLAFCCVLFASTAWAVELTGQVRGTIEDSKGLAVPGVTIEISSPALQGNRSATSDVNGGFRFTALPVGTYTLVSSLAGKNAVQTELQVASGQTATVRLKMNLASDDNMLIEADTPVVDTTSTRTGTVMTKDEFLDQFAQMNTFIESALSMQDFDRARLIDGARRRMLQEFAASNVF